VQGVHFHFHSPSPQQSCLLVQQAQKMLAEALRDEPDWQAVLRVEKIEFRAGTANEPAAALPQASGSYPLPRGRRDCSAPYPRWEE